MFPYIYITCYAPFPLIRSHHLNLVSGEETRSFSFSLPRIAGLPCSSDSIYTNGSCRMSYRSHNGRWGIATSNPEFKHSPKQSRDYKPGTIAETSTCSIYKKNKAYC